MAESSDEDSNGDLLLRTLLEEEGPPLGNSNQQHQQEEEQQHHLKSIGAAIVTHQLPSLGLSFQLWPAAASLLSLLDLDPSRLLLPHSSPLRLLELGSGTGLAGIAAAVLLRADVTLTDLPHVLPNLRSNAESNGPLVAARGGSLRVRQLRWGSSEDEAALGGTAFDAVLAADVVYHEHLFDPLLRTLGAFVKKREGEGEGTAFLMAHLRRWKKRDALFFRKARKRFRVALVHTDPPLPGSRTGVAVYRFTAK